MTATAPTVRDLFISGASGEPCDTLALPPVPTGLSSIVSNLEWSALADRVFDVLDINVIDILIAGWKKHHEVAEQLAATAVDPSRTMLVHLADHTLDSTHKPSIELRFQGRKLTELVFAVTLTFEIEAVELTLRAGAIREIRPGNVKVKGTVKLENSVLLKRELSPVHLPGKLMLEVAPSEGVQRPVVSAV